MTVLYEWLTVVLVVFGAFCAFWMLTECEHAPAPRKCELRDEERKAG